MEKSRPRYFSHKWTAQTKTLWAMLDKWTACQTLWAINKNIFSFSTTYLLNSPGTYLTFNTENLANFAERIFLGPRGPG